MRILPALLCVAFVSGTALAQDGGALRARHTALHEQLANNPFGRPLHVESSTAGGAHKGEIYAVIEKPYSVVAPALARPAGWCDILTLQVNIKRCNASEDTLAAFITRKARDPLDSAHRVDFRYQLATSTADYLHVALRSRAGPVGTRDYEIVVEAAPLDARRTFLHMSYAYTLGSMARFAMDAYLAGAGREKVGFSVVDRLPDGRPVHVDGVRGVVERNAMRYYLAVEAHLESQNLETRLRHWYAATARYPQLRETVGPDEYVQMKRKEAREPS
ncbi:MAG TPA: hypothetical protein VGX52_03140 [Burkholderiales bacterium]|nr:hypothetical protein [Burkholderiales bacterium]